MKKRYLTKLTPLEPYFFGNEKSLWFGNVESQKTNSYFIKSNYIPYPPTIFGAIRFSLLDEHYNIYRTEQKIKEANFEKIGRESFNIEKKDQTFGRIKKVSPLFLTCKNKNKEDIYFIKTPFDHKIKNEDGCENLYYRPFFQYEGCETSVGKKYLPLDFNAKDGICDSFLNLSTMEICNDLFTSFIRVGIKTDSDNKGFFKKEYRNLTNKNMSFAVFADIEGEVNNKIVFLGQDKSAFSLSFEEVGDEIGVSIFEQKLMNYRKNLKENLVVENSKVAIALSDIYVDKKVYDYCYFVNTATREHRTFITDYGNVIFRERYKKGSEIISLLKAGSMFLIKDQHLEDFQIEINHKNCQTIGMNICIFGRF